LFTVDELFLCTVARLGGGGGKGKRGGGKSLTWGVTSVTRRVREGGGQGEGRPTSSPPFLQRVEHNTSG
jgi:hypothetical protein